MKLYSNYWYLSAKLNYNKNELPYPLTTSFVVVIFKSSLRILFGEVASTYQLDVLKFDEDSQTAIVRVPKDNYVKVRAALVLLSSMEVGQKNIPLIVSVLNSSPCLLSLAGPQTARRCLL